MNFPSALEEGYAGRLGKRRQALSSLALQRMGGSPTASTAAAAVGRTVTVAKGAMAPDTASFLSTARALEVAVTREVARLMKIEPDSLSWQKPQVDALLSRWAQDNAALVAKMEAEMLQDVEQRVASAPPETDLRQLAAARFSVYEARARLIARDQLGSLQSQLTELRAKGAGSTHYKWVSRKDTRVRPRHEKLHGTVRRWDDPHPTEGHPGQAIACRCTAEPLPMAGSVSVSMPTAPTLTAPTVTVTVPQFPALPSAPPPAPEVPTWELQELPELPGAETVTPFAPLPVLPPPAPPPVLPPLKIPELPVVAPPPAPSVAETLLERDYQEFGEDQAKEYGPQLIAQRQALTGKEKASVGMYSGGGFIEINAALRSGRTHRSVEALDAALAKGGITDDLVVWRGVGERHPVLSQTSLLRPGAILQEDAYTSTSLSKGSAFGGGPLLKIRLPAGSPAAFISDLSDHPKELEVLIGRGARFQVLGVSETGYGRTVVELLLLPGGT